MMDHDDDGRCRQSTMTTMTIDGDDDGRQSNGCNLFDRDLTININRQGGKPIPRDDNNGRWTR